jgi:hypothetical protein
MMGEESTIFVVEAVQDKIEWGYTAESFCSLHPRLKNLQAVGQAKPAAMACHIFTSWT